MELPTQDEASGWPGSPVKDDQGAVLGECVGVFADAETGVTDWLDISVPGHGRALVPALDALKVDGQLHVSYPRALVLSAPRVDADVKLVKQDEIRLYDHYGVEYSNEQSSTLLPAGVEIAASEPEPVPQPTSSSFAAPPAAVPVAATAVSPGRVPAAAATAPTAPTAEPQPTPGRPADPAPPAPASRSTSPRGSAIVPPGGLSLTPTTSQDRLSEEPPTPAAGRDPDERAVDNGPALLPTAAPVGNGALPAMTPLGVIIGLAVAVAVGLRVRDLRPRRRRKPAAWMKRRIRVRSKALQTTARWRVAAPRAASRWPAGVNDVLRSRSRTAARPGQAAARRAVATPHLVAARGRRARRALFRPIWRGIVIAAVGAGYTAGARAGTSRYEQLRDTAVRLARSQQVQRSRSVATEQAQKRGRAVVAALDPRGAARWEPK